MWVEVGMIDGVIPVDSRVGLLPRIGYTLFDGKCRSEAFVSQQPIVDGDRSLLVDVEQPAVFVDELYRKAASIQVGATVEPTAGEVGIQPYTVLTQVCCGFGPPTQTTEWPRFVTAS